MFIISLYRIKEINSAFEYLEKEFIHMGFKPSLKLAKIIFKANFKLLNYESAHLKYKKFIHLFPSIEKDTTRIFYNEYENYLKMKEKCNEHYLQNISMFKCILDLIRRIP